MDEVDVLPWEELIDVSVVVVVVPDAVQALDVALHGAPEQPAAKVIKLFFFFVNDYPGKGLECWTREC